MISEFIENVKEEKDGFRFGKVFRFDEESIVAILPILRNIKKEREYVVLSESRDIKINDTGNIDKTKIINNGDKPVYIRQGTILKGSTQERASIISRIIFPGKTEEIKVVCVHQTKGISRGAVMSYSGLTPSSIKLDSQRATWNSVSRYSCSAQSESIRSTSGDIPMASMSPPIDDLVAYVSGYSDKIEKILPKIEHKKNQTGMVLFDIEGVCNIEIFDLTESWKAIRDDVISREAEKIVKKDLQGIFQLKPERANELAIKVLEQKYEESELYKNSSSVYSLKSNDYIGEVTILNEKIIHFALSRKEN